MSSTAAETSRSERGPVCDECGASLAPDQRYCLSCGARVGALSFPGPSPIAAKPAPRRQFKLPTPRTAAVVAATTLGFGIFFGIVIGPSLSGTSYATAPLSLVLPAPASSPSSGGSANGGGPTPPLNGPVASKPAPAPTSPPTPAAPAAAAPLPGTTAPTTPTNTFPTQPATNDNGGSGGGQGGGGGDHDRGGAGTGGGTGGRGNLPPYSFTIGGTVVHQNPSAGSYTVATAAHRLFAVHADKLTTAGTKLSATVNSLFNGTFAEKRTPTRSGTTTEARFAGTVSYVDPTIPGYTVSVRGTSMLVHVRSDGSTAPALPAVGDDVDLTTSIEKARPEEVSSPPGTTTSSPTTTSTTTPTTTTPTTTTSSTCQPTTTPAADTPATVLVEKAVKTTGRARSVYLTGTVEATCPDSSQLVLSADDAGESTAGLTLSVADGIRLAKLKKGEPVIARAEIGSDDAMTVTGLESDDGAKGANDPATAQGDLASSKAAARASHDRRAGASRRYLRPWGEALKAWSATRR